MPYPVAAARNRNFGPQTSAPKFFLAFDGDDYVSLPAGSGQECGITPGGRGSRRTAPRGCRPRALAVVRSGGFPDGFPSW